MVQRNRYSNDQFPPTNLIAAAIRNLPKPDRNIPPQRVVIDAGPVEGRYSVIFVVRLNSDLQEPAWFWGIESGERIPRGQAGPPGQLPQDPD